MSRASDYLRLRDVLVALHFFHALLTPEICESFFAREELIDVFQLQTLGLREEEVDDWNPGRVENGKDDICAPANVVDGSWRDLDDDLTALLVLFLRHN